MSSEKNGQLTKNRVSDAQKNTRATSVTKNEPALKLIQKPSLTSASIDAREGLTLSMMHCLPDSCKQNLILFLFSNKDARLFVEN